MAGPRPLDGETYQNSLLEQNTVLHHELRVARHEAQTFRDAVEKMDKKRLEQEEQIRQLKAELQFKSQPIVHHHYYHQAAPYKLTNLQFGTGSPPPFSAGGSTS